MSSAASLPILLFEIQSFVSDEILFKPLAISLAPGVSKLFPLMLNFRSLLL